MVDASVLGWAAKRGIFVADGLTITDFPGSGGRGLAAGWHRPLLQLLYLFRNLPPLSPPTKIIFFSHQTGTKIAAGTAIVRVPAEAALSTQSALECSYLSPLLKDETARFAGKTQNQIQSAVLSNAAGLPPTAAGNLILGHLDHV